MQDIDKQKQKPKKIVINNVRKSIMASGGIINSGGQPNIAQVAGLMQGQSSFTNQPNSNNTQVQKANEQLLYYRQKHDQSLIKVRFLIDKLESYGGLSSIPQAIMNEISQTDSKIKNLQQLLYFRRSKQMKKLKKKIQKFIEMLQFDISEDDLNKIEDEIQIIFFLVDIFSEKYNNIMSEKAEIDQIVQALKEDTVFTRQQLEQQNKYLKQKATQSAQYIRDLQLQMFNLKKDANNYARNASSIETLLRNQSVYSTQNTKVFDETIRSLQIQNENLMSKIFNLENTIKNHEYQIINYKRKIEDYEHLLQKEKAKYRQLQEQFEKVQREEVRWKQRYEIMEKQKNQRIELLQRQKRTSENISFANSARSNFSPGQYRQQRDELMHDDRRLPKINIKKKMVFNPKFKVSDDHILEDSGEQYYDVASR